MHLSKLTVRGFRASADSEVEVKLPGRFSVLVGANAAGKTTVSDSLYLGHAHRFPRLPPVTAATLGDGTRNIDIEYSFASDTGEEGPLGIQIQDQSGQTPGGAVATRWSRGLRRDLGVVRATNDEPSEHADAFRLIYLPAQRNPLDELARREVRILVELLRAQQQAMTGSRNLEGLRARAASLLDNLSTDPLIGAVEERIDCHLAALSTGVSRQWPYVRGQRVDDQYLARVLELMLAVLEGRQHTRPLEVSGLGYVNLLHIAVTLAAIPDLTDSEGGNDSAEDAGDDLDAPGEELEPAIDAQADAEDAERRLAQARAEQDSEEDSFFTAAPFHVTVLIEEPEAHLHPQLQHALVRYLRRVVTERPEIQVILSSHAPDVISSCDPEQIVVLRRPATGGFRSSSIASIPLTDRSDVLRKTRLHLDASRSSALLAGRVALVEGVTDAALLREFGRVWAKGDGDKLGFIDALSIVPIGTKVGSWPVRLLATRDHEVADAVAILRDSDRSFDETPQPPTWLADHDSAIVRAFFSHPTLEPSITAGNEELVAAAVTAIGLEPPDPFTAEAVADLFRSARRSTASGETTSAGPGASRKGEFALEMAARLRGAEWSEVIVPQHLSDLFDFLYASAQGPTEDLGESDDEL
jgi:putative ATP-dependent endonuclease of OLD family